MFIIEKWGFGLPRSKNKGMPRRDLYTEGITLTQMLANAKYFYLDEHENFLREEPALDSAARLYIRNNYNVLMNKDEEERHITNIID